MAVIVIKDAYVLVNSVNLSSWVRSVSINYNAEVKDATTMGVGSKQKKAGLIDWSVDIEFNQDWASGGPDDTLFALVGTDDVPIAIRHKSDAISATNPEYQGVGVISSYPILDAAAGEIPTAAVTIDGSGVLTRDVTP